MNLSINLLQKIHNLRNADRLLHLSRNSMRRVQENSFVIHTTPDIEIFNYLNNRNLGPETNWKDVREDILKESRNITPINIDAMMLNYYTTKKMYDVAFKYLNYLKEDNIKLNLATIGKYFKLFYELYREGKLTQEQKEVIWYKYKELQKMYKVLDPITTESVICALSITEHWKECLVLMEKVKIVAVPSAISYSLVIAAAFRNEEHQLGYQLLEEMLLNNRVPYNVLRHSYWSSCNKLNNTEKAEKLKEFFEILNVYALKCDTSDKEILQSTFSSFNFDVRDTAINKSGICKCCNKRLDKLQLTEVEFKDLKEYFIEKVIIGKNIFYKTTPVELEGFKTFVSNMDKYDVVMDGLNVAYSAGSKQTPKFMAFLILSVVQHFTKQNQKVLVIGRKHMAKWHSWSDIRRNAATFLTDNISQDDPYLLYCALMSGNNTKLISRDMMRSHLHVLKDYKHKLLFHRWLSQNRHELLHVDSNGKVFFKYPLPYNVSNQKQEDIWHIPYEDNNTKEKVIKWFCIGK